MQSVIEGRILTIEEFGGKPDSQINTAQEPIHHPEFHHSSTKLKQDHHHKNHHTIHHRSKASDDPELIKLAVANREAYNLALINANPGDTILLLENESYSFIGGIYGENLRNITLDFAGYTRFLYNTEFWPISDFVNEAIQVYHPAIDMLNCAGIVITSSAKNKAIVKVDYKTNEIFMDEESGSGGIIDGHGKNWWNAAILGNINVDARPRLLDIRGCMNVTLEHVTLVNSPYWTVTLEAIGAEVHHVNVLVDRDYQRNLINNTVTETWMQGLDDLAFEGVTNSHSSSIRNSRRTLREKLKFHFPDIIPNWLLQPQDLNTDGIDPIGRDIHIHDCIVLNDDDSIAVKPSRSHRGEGSVMNGTMHYQCTGNITIEDMVLTGFGASIGSVGPQPSHPCVDNVRFKNIHMPGSAKGIYIKSNKSDCKGNVTSRISNILYENIYIKDPMWWPIWIGPQQQHEPHEELGGACSLEYPLQESTCPTQGCSTFENITLRNVLIENPFLSPGVIMGNSSNPMRNIEFDNVTMTVSYKNYFTHGRLPFHNKRFPFAGKFQCENVISGTCKGCNPVPDCFEVVS